MSIIAGGIGLEPIFIIPFFPKFFIGKPVLAFNDINWSSLVKKILIILLLASYAILLLIRLLSFELYDGNINTPPLSESNSNWSLLLNCL